MSRLRAGTKLEMVLMIFVIAVIVRQFFLGNYENMFLGILTLVLFMVPKIIEKRLNVSIPNGLKNVILIFIFSAEILGEINEFYVKIPIWDTILHTTNGFLMAAIGFALIDIFNRSERFSVKMSPYFVAFTAFCFSMTVGVLWEFFEFSMDWFFNMDMQKDWIITRINSVKLHPEGKNIPVHIDIKSVVINGENWNLGGYLDIGLIDTMKDLIVNFIGAVVFSVVGIFYLKYRKEGGIAESLIPVVEINEKASVTIETDRLMLREMTMDDFDGINDFLSDSDVMKYYKETFNESKVKEWILNNIERYGTFGFGLWVVVLKETGEIIGDCGITMQNINGQIKPEIGYHIRADKQKQGFGSEAAKRVRDWAFDNTSFNTLYSYMSEDNVASYSTAKVIGMHKVDEFKDENNVLSKVYAMTREEWGKINNLL